MNLTSFHVLLDRIFRRRQIILMLIGFCVAVVLSSCNTVIITEYEATALTTLTWRVEYSINSTTDRDPDVEEFASKSVVNRNGEKPEGAVTGPDDKGLWWPVVPPKPSIDEVEQRQPLHHKPSKPELLRTVKYDITYKEGAQIVTLPTNYDVYRQVARAYPYQKPLRLTLGINDASVQKADTK
ncbi:hypothetical protein [Moorena bouillonii]|nr:hypothetical protein [Moorena bouillonii]NEO46894.1 hypothetical protein [Moorena sp. SIO4A3]